MKNFVHALLFSISLLFFSASLVAQEDVSNATTTTSSPEFIYVSDAFSSQISGFHLAANGTLVPTPGSPYGVSVNPPISLGSLSLAYIAPFLVAANSDPDAKTGMTVFKVNQQTGALTPVAQPGPQTTFVDWEFVAADPQKRIVYAMGEDNGDPTQPNGLATFRLTTEGIMERVGVPIKTGPSEGAIAIDPLGRFVYVLSSSQVFVWKRNADGTLGTQVSGSPFKVGLPPVLTSPTPNPCFSANVQPTLAVHPNGRFVYSSCNQGQQLTVSVVSSTGKITPAGSIPLRSSLDRLSSLFVNKAGTVLYGTEEQRNLVLTFAISSNGKPVLRAENAAGSRPNGVAEDTLEKHLFVSNGSSNIFKGNFVPGSNNLSYYSSSGTLATQSKESPVSTGTAPRSVTIVVGH